MFNCCYCWDAEEQWTVWSDTVADFCWEQRVSFLLNMCVFWCITMKNAKIAFKSLLTLLSTTYSMRQYKHGKHSKSLDMLLTYSYYYYYTTSQLVSWPSGRTSVFSRRTFPVLREICSWRVTTYVGKPSAIAQPTTPTQPFTPSGPVNQWVVSCNWMSPTSIRGGIIWWTLTKERQAWCIWVNYSNKLVVAIDNNRIWLLHCALRILLPTE